MLGLKPLFSAPVVMIGFQVEPGANWPWVARNSSGLSGLVGVEPVELLRSVMPPTQTFGSYVGSAGHRDDAAVLGVEHHDRTGVGDVVAVR